MWTDKVANYHENYQGKKITMCCLKSYLQEGVRSWLKNNLAIIYEDCQP